MNFLSFFIAILVLYIVLKIISLPLKVIIKFMINALLGGIVLFIINLVGAQFGLVLNINWITSSIVGLLGIPGVIIVVIMHFLL